ncbi:retinitis pigmentosa 1-like 1 protein isoform X2 [Pseudophryne corroboree]|uniref:retinitis pigmentosa 1-like 1 protein isoform X2 n=1 Tax=Pseudophryne corroboree TaxID=495146 RepID=UPI003081F742
MKKKKRVTGARKRLGGSTLEPEPSEQSLPYQEPTEKPMMQAGASQENNMRRDALLLSLSRPEGLQPGSWLATIEDPLHPNNLNVSSSWPLSAVLPTCHQGDRKGTDGEGSSALHVTSFAETTQSSTVDQVRDRSVECSPCVTLLNLPESGTCETYPEVSLIGTCSEWTSAITSLSGLHTKRSCLEGDNAMTLELSPVLSAVSNVHVQLPLDAEPSTSIPQTLSPIQTDKSQPDPQDTQGIRNTSCFSDWGENLPEQGLNFSHDQKLMVLLSPKRDQKANKDLAPPCEGDPTTVYEGHPTPPCEGDPPHLYIGEPTPQYEGCPNSPCEGEHAPPCERDLMPPCDGDSATRCEGDPAPPCEGDPTQCEGDPTPQCEGDPTPPCEGDPTPPCEGDPTPPCEGDPTPPCEGNPTPQCEGDPTPQCEGDLTPQCEGDPTPSCEGDPTPPCEGDPPTPCEGGPIPQCEGNPIPQCVRDPTPPCEGNPIPQCEGNPTPQCEGNPTPQCEGNPIPQCEGNPTPQCEGDCTPPHERDPILVQGRGSVLEDSGEPATVLDVPDSQLLGALEESFCELGQTAGEQRGRCIIHCPRTDNGAVKSQPSYYEHLPRTPTEEGQVYPRKRGGEWEETPGNVTHLSTCPFYVVGTNKYTLLFYPSSKWSSLAYTLGGDRHAVG